MRQCFKNNGAQTSGRLRTSDIEPWSAIGSIARASVRRATLVRSRRHRRVIATSPFAVRTTAHSQPFFPVNPASFVSFITMPKRSSRTPTRRAPNRRRFPAIRPIYGLLGAFRVPRWCGGGSVPRPARAELAAAPGHRKIGLHIQALGRMAEVTGRGRVVVRPAAWQARVPGLLRSHVGDGLQVFALKSVFGRNRHRADLVAVQAPIGDLRRDDDRAPGVDGGPEVMGASA